MSHQEYMASPEWATLRDQAIKRDGGKCCDCGSRLHLQVHHHTYPAQNWELDCLDNLTTLCGGCHKEIHERRKEENEATRKRNKKLMEDQWIRMEKRRQKDENFYEIAKLLFLVLIIAFFLFLAS